MKVIGCAENFEEKIKTFHINKSVRFVFIITQNQDSPDGKRE